MSYVPKKRKNIKKEQNAKNIIQLFSFHIYIFDKIKYNNSRKHEQLNALQDENKIML